MGASGNSDSTRIAALQERKKQIQEKLDSRNIELRKLCIEEAELTGSLPIEYPFEQGEEAPIIRRRVGATYQLNQSLLNNLNNEEEIPKLEVELHMLDKMAQAALGLAKDNTANKAARKAYLTDYEHHMQRHKSLENKLHDLKISDKSLLKMQKKKARPEHEDSVSMHLNVSEPFGKTFRHSSRSLQYQSTQSAVVASGRPASQRFVYHAPESVPDASHVRYPSMRNEPAVFKLSIDGYKQYEEQRETVETAIAEGHFRFYPNQANISRTLPHVSRRSPQAAIQFTDKFTGTTYASQTLLRHTSSPGASSANVKYIPQRQYLNESRLSMNANPHQLQPHQQYEQNVMTSGAGLGGYWKQSEHGEFWCNATADAVKEKRFSSLDRRKNKRVQKKLAQEKGSTLTVASTTSHDSTRTLPTKSQAIAIRRHESRQLVRTQSLGSVGGITVDSLCPSDDSSCGSENINCDQLFRKNKQKEWYETSLDGPVSCTSRPQSTVPSIAPEEIYVEYSGTPPNFLAQKPSPYPSPISPKEIPAESYPSPRLPETNLKIFNNNLPKNGTVVQQAQWKPYHEETKPFEMSDFYKYSTKFKKKSDDGQASPSSSTTSSRPQGFRNLPHSMQQMQSNNRNSDISTSSYDSNEVNAWYQQHEHHHSDNNNATLV